jgi:hypothetical protein
MSNSTHSEPHEFSIGHGDASESPCPTEILFISTSDNQSKPVHGGQVGEVHIAAAYRFENPGRIEVHIAETDLDMTI